MKELTAVLGVGLLIACAMASMMWLIIKRLVSTSTPLNAETIDDRQYSALIKDIVKTRKPPSGN